ncbi:carbohydrate ABC transporter permease [Paenibacillus sp. CF384]|uniref:carbohydrate ABC transporter permease n=1 Tax=Paenibacillus sp. CF384 TaxID=1884382 RepID=UPI000896184F|nr:carbohydrate ABC transporter permease [Paenibacillus sp. CF384]SDX63575.1 putative aldouronate transport system permease protein [Paenibacillus sp. CF384]
MNHESTSYKVFKVANIVFLSVLVFIMVFPFLNVLAYAFNDPLDSQFGGITIYPRVFTFNNFMLLFQNQEVIHALWISLCRVAAGTTLAVLVQYACAYAFTLKDVTGRGALLIFLIIPMYFNGGLIPTYLIYSELHVSNTFWVYILPVSFSLYNMVIIRSYLFTIPDSLGESARIDGANDFTIMTRIYMPLSMPIIAVMTLWTAVYHWNDWTTTLYYVTNHKLFTMQYILMQILKEGERVAKLMEEALMKNITVVSSGQPHITPQAIRSANIIVTSIPILIIYPFLQRFFVKGITLGAVKE